MKRKLLLLMLSLVALFGAGNASADRPHGRFGVGVVVGPGWGPWYYPPFYSPFYYPPAYPPVIIERQAPPVYIEQSPPVQNVQPSAQNYWYYCQSPAGYYPDIAQCPGGWVKILPRQ